MVVPCVMIACVLTVDGLTDSLRKSDAGIVLGSKVNPDGTLSPRLQARLDRAVTLHQDSYVTFLIVSGGFGKEGHDEATVMKNYLLQKGIPEKNIIVDCEGNNTLASAINAQKLKSKYKIESLTIITQYFHMTRSRIAFQNCGFSALGTAHAYFFELRDLYSIMREIPATVLYLIKTSDSCQNQPL
jgi:vancomycin permeability regulator SanA